jgi:hypothetical protein
VSADDPRPDAADPMEGADPMEEPAGDDPTPEATESRKWADASREERRQFVLEGVANALSKTGEDDGPAGGSPTLAILSFMHGAFYNLRRYLDKEDVGADAPEVTWASPVVELEYETPWASFRQPAEGPVPIAGEELEPGEADLETADAAVAWGTDTYLRMAERVLLHALTHEAFYEVKRGKLVPYLPKALEAAPWADVAPLLRPWTFGGEAGDAWWQDFLADFGVIHTADAEPADADLPAFTLKATASEDDGTPVASDIHPVIALYPAVIDRKAKRAYYPLVVGFVVEGTPLSEWPPAERERLWDELFGALEQVAGDVLPEAPGDAEGEAVEAPMPPDVSPVRRGRAVDVPVWTPPPILAYQQAAADARTGRNFIEAPGGGLVHARGKAGYMVNYTDPEASVAELMHTLNERGGMDAVFVVAAAVQHALEHEGEPVHIDDLLLDIGWDRTHGGREEARQSLAATLLMFNAWAVVGTNWGTFTDPKTGQAIDVSSRGPLFTSTILYPAQGTLDNSSPPVGATFMLGDFLRRVHDYPQVMASFSTYARLAKIRRGKPSGAWAAVIGLALLVRWRELASKTSTRITTPGEQNRLTVRTQNFTRRYLLETFPPEPTAAEVLGGPQPGRAKKYWRDAIAILRREGIIGPDPSDYRELGGPLPRYQWGDAWLDEALEVRPAPACEGDFLALAERAGQERKKRRRRKPKQGA